MPLTILRSHFRSLISHRCSTNGYYLLPSRNFVVDSDHYYCLHVRLARCALNQVSETNALDHRSVPSSRSKRPLSTRDRIWCETSVDPARGIRWWLSSYPLQEQRSKCMCSSTRSAGKNNHSRCQRPGGVNRGNPPGSVRPGRKYFPS